MSLSLLPRASERKKTWAQRRDDDLDHNIERQKQ
jgi:hypothetical protein